ncbi:unnamed protein product [Gongylonema pulchrum]|uniref:IBB domain-containing protein n=1 Tax=Gongylonema pulchrum TaxID=637853 RepID=A0A3P7NNQ8_9BILA|nr:unnamed protein product [Gongylonema pulchrum]
MDRPDALPNLHRILLDGDPKTKREVAWALSNIAAGNSKQIQAIFDAGIVPSLMNILSNETFRTRTEVCWVIANLIAGGNEQHISEIVKLGVLLAFSDMLTVMDSGLVLVILKALECILMAGESSKAKVKSKAPLQELLAAHYKGEGKILKARVMLLVKSSERRTFIY